MRLLGTLCTSMVLRVLGSFHARVLLTVRNCVDLFDVLRVMVIFFCWTAHFTLRSVRIHLLCHQNPLQMYTLFIRTIYLSKFSPWKVHFIKYLVYDRKIELSFFFLLNPFESSV